MVTVTVPAARMRGRRTWLKIKYREYSQAEGRHEFFNDSLRVGSPSGQLYPAVCENIVQDLLSELCSGRPAGLKHLDQLGYERQVRTAGLHSPQLSDRNRQRGANFMMGGKDCVGGHAG
jgi:hypothetical protein